MRNGLFQRPTQSGWVRDDKHPELEAFVADLWLKGIDTATITHELRNDGWAVTEAGVANVLGVWRDKLHAYQTQQRAAQIAAE